MLVVAAYLSGSDQSLGYLRRVWLFPLKVVKHGFMVGTSSSHVYQWEADVYPPNNHASSVATVRQGSTSGKSGRNYREARSTSAYRWQRRGYSTVLRLQRKANCAYC